MHQLRVGLVSSKRDGIKLRNLPGWNFRSRDRISIIIQLHFVFHGEIRRDWLKFVHRLHGRDVLFKLSRVLLLFSGHLFQQRSKCLFCLRGRLIPSEHRGLHLRHLPIGVIRGNYQRHGLLELHPRLFSECIGLKQLHELRGGQIFFCVIVVIGLQQLCKWQIRRLRQSICLRQLRSRPVCTADWILELWRLPHQHLRVISRRRQLHDLLRRKHGPGGLHRLLGVRYIHGDALGHQ